MEKRTRSISRSKKAPRSKTPVASPRGRGRPPKDPSEKKNEKKGRRASRSRTRERAPEKKEQPKRSRSRSVEVRSQPTKKKESKVVDETQLKKPELIVNDIMKGGKLNDIIRRSLSRDVEISEEKYRRSSRRIASRTEVETKAESWSKTAKSEKFTPEPRKIEFGGWIGVFFHIALLAGLTIFTMFGCTRDQCELKPFHIPRNWRLYLNPYSAGIVVGFVVLQLIVQLIPLGRVVRIPNSATTFRANGVLALVLTGSSIAGLWYAGYPVTIVYERWVSLITTAYILSWLIGISLFIKARRAPFSAQNPYGNTGNVFYDMYVGRELHPVLFGRINVKVFLFRCGIIGCVMVNALLTLRGWEVRKEISPTLLVSSVMHIIYCLDALWFEESSASTFELQYEGTGLMSAHTLAFFPFVPALVPRFILTHRVELSTAKLIISGVFFSIGLFIYRASNLQKAAFRKNPLDPALSYLQTIPTSRGKKLLVSGWWGLIKHPNYLGDIILVWGWTSTVGFTHIVPYIVPLLTTLILFHRAGRDFKRCQDRYQASWQEYHRRVPYSIIPYVY